MNVAGVQSSNKPADKKQKEKKNSLISPRVNAFPSSISPKTRLGFTFSPFSLKFFFVESGNETFVYIRYLLLNEKKCK